MFFFPYGYPVYIPNDGLYIGQQSLPQPQSLTPTQDNKQSPSIPDHAVVKVEERIKVLEADCEQNVALKKEQNKQEGRKLNSEQSQYVPMNQLRSGEESDPELPRNPKKNTQSNIINQIISYLCNKKLTQHTLKNLLKDNKKVASFYQIAQYLKKSKKKYVTIKYLEHVCFMGAHDVGYKMLIRMRNKMNVLTIHEFQRAVAILSFYYLRCIFDSAILTSIKVNKNTILEHMERKRKIYQQLVAVFQLKSAKK